MNNLSDYLAASNKLLSEKLPSDLYRLLRFRLQDFAGFTLGHDLRLLASIYRSDKGTVHDYVELYSRAFQEKRLDKLLIFEIGVGGYNEPTAGGQSLRMWSRYFPNSIVIGIDYYRKDLSLPSNVFLERADQSQCHELKAIVDKYGPPDIVIDDGSHYSDHIISSFLCLYPFVRPGGFYCIEDLHTSYWPSGFCGNDWEGSIDVYSKSTSIALIKRCIDSLNISDMLEKPIDSLPSDGDLQGIFCSRGLAILQKKSLSDRDKGPQHIRAMRHSSIVDNARG
jgi:hypothetical protein